MAFGNEFGLAEQEFDLAAFLSVQPLLDIDELFRRNSEEDDLAGR